MRLYFSPFACSLAARVALDEAGLNAEFIMVGPDRTLPNGQPFSAINPLGYVPVLELDDGSLLTETSAVLQWIADRTPDAGLAPAPASGERYRLQRWLNFVSTELHKGVFTPLLDKAASDGARDYARSKLRTRFDYLGAHLGERDHLLDAVSVADLYLVAVLNWCEVCQVRLGDWPIIESYRARMRRRPSVARAMAVERPFLKAA